MVKTSRSKNDYSTKSVSRSLQCEEQYINPNRLTKGNSKLHKILIFDLPAGKSCLNCSSCFKRCYARKAEVQYPETEIYRATNFHLAKFKLGLLKDLIIKQLLKTSFKTARIHASGDFFSQEYVNFWNDIIIMFPNINFYAYTKVDKILDFDVINKNANFNLIPSLIDDKVLNFGSVEYCENLKQKYGTFICPVVASNHKDFKCGRECSYCVTKKNVCFVEH